MIYIIHFLVAVFFAVFVMEVFFDDPQPALLSLGVFIGNYTLVWLFSAFYSKRHFRKVPMVLALFLYYLKELCKSSIKVAYDVMTPTHHMKPGVIAFPMQAKSDLEITLLANFITLTPGSLSIDVSEDKTILYIHETYLRHGDIEKYKEKLKNGFEKRILKITR